MIYASGLFLLLAVFLYSGIGSANYSESDDMDLINNYDDIYKKYAYKYSVDWRLLKAIAIIESEENPSAINPSDPSIGLMQILCVGWPYECRNKLPSVYNWPPEDLNDLLDPDYNVSIGAAILSYNIGGWGFWHGVAIYNNWGARDESVPYSNQAYVDNVKRVYDKLVVSNV